MRRVKLQGRKALNADVISPEYEYFTFSDGLCTTEVKNIANELNAGNRMIDIVREHVDDRSIDSIHEMVDKLWSAFGDYEQKRYSICRCKS